MIPEKVLKALLEASGPVTAEVVLRLYDQTMPEGDPLPAIVWQLISDVAEPPIQAGVNQQPTAARVQVNCLAHTSAQCKALAELVRSACNLQSGTIAGAVVLAIFCDLGPTSYDPLVDIYTQPIDVLIHYLR
jgi:hypothetical protein